MIIGWDFWKSQPNELLLLFFQLLVYAVSERGGLVHITAVSTGAEEATESPGLESTSSCSEPMWVQGTKHMSSARVLFYVNHDM